MDFLQGVCAMEHLIIKAVSLVATFMLCSALFAHTNFSPVSKTYHFQADENEAETTIWTCFPVIDSTAYQDDIYRNSLGYMFGDSTLSAPLNDLLRVQWLSRVQMYMMYWQDFWINLEKRVWPQEGYKLTYRRGAVDQITVHGYAPDPDSVTCNLRGKNNSAYFAESWLGYFLPQTQSVGQAFSRPFGKDSSECCLDYLYVIKTQNQATCRVLAEKDSPWIIDPFTLSLKEGDMVEVRLLPFSPETMLWNTQNGSYKAVPRAAHFAVTHTADYTPIFIEFDPEDLPDEVGLYVSGVCKGAAVVDSTLMEVNYYSSDAAKSDDEIEVMFYYGGKGIKKAPATRVYNSETMLFEDGKLKASSLGEYGYISFNRGEGSSLVPLVTELKQNYPNPFKGFTKISWVLEKDEPISVDIYNVKGQKVKSLFNGQGKKGRKVLSWDTKDNNGQSVASGIYFYRLNTPEGTKVQKMMVLK